MPRPSPAWREQWHGLPPRPRSGTSQAFINGGRERLRPFLQRALCEVGWGSRAAGCGWTLWKAGRREVEAGLSFSRLRCGSPPSASGGLRRASPSPGRLGPGPTIRGSHGGRCGTRAAVGDVRGVGGWPRSTRRLTPLVPTGRPWGRTRAPGAPPAGPGLLERLHAEGYPEVKSKSLVFPAKCDTIRTGSRSLFGDGHNVKLFTSPMEGGETARAGNSSGCSC
ncbi:uncharacterized protein LOC134518840 [Chroicocephalus ridibundus]|uniref:uncharacterized protein LOC134518840 n=1 Tax=Chroicocephalus ridibundus TaxID=1192867 RepID=UPI002FDD9B83